MVCTIPEQYREFSIIVYDKFAFSISINFSLPCMPTNFVLSAIS